MYLQLKELRKENNLSIYDMANKLNISAVQYYFIENQKRILYYDMAIKISRIFNMRPDQIFYTEKSNDFELCFYKIFCKITYILKSQVDKQLTDIIDFLEYEKKLYTLDASLVLTKLLEEKQKTTLEDGFDQKIGLYCDTLKFLHKT